MCRFRKRRKKVFISKRQTDKGGMLKPSVEKRKKLRGEWGPSWRNVLKIGGKKEREQRGTTKALLFRWKKDWTRFEEGLPWKVPPVY